MIEKTRFSHKTKSACNQRFLLEVRVSSSTHGVWGVSLGWQKAYTENPLKKILSSQLRHADSRTSLRFAEWKKLHAPLSFWQQDIARDAAIIAFIVPLQWRAAASLHSHSEHVRIQHASVHDRKHIPSVCWLLEIRHSVVANARVKYCLYREQTLLQSVH